MAPARDIKIAKWILLLLLALMAIKAVLNWLEEPVISVDYVRHMNNLRHAACPEDANDGGGMFLKACKVMSGQWIDSDRYLGFHNTNGTSFKISRPLWPSDMNQTDRANVAAWLADNDQALRLAEYAMSQRSCHFDLYSRDNDLNYLDIHHDLAGDRQVYAAMFWRAKFRAADGDVEDALRDVLLVSRMSGNFVNYPVMGERWKGQGAVEDSCWTALEIASHVQLSAEQLSRLTDGLETSGKPYYVIGTALEYDRLFMRDMVQRYYSDDGSGDGRLLAGHAYRYSLSRHGDSSIGEKFAVSMECVALAFTTPSRKVTLEKCDADINKTIRLSELPLWELRDKYANDVKSLGNDADGITFAWSNSILTSYLYAPQRFRNIVEGTLATLAVLRYKAEKGTLPESLDELVSAGYLKEVPLDRWSGKPFVYEKRDSDFLLYSIGEVTTEDGRRGSGRITFWPVTGFYKGHPIPPLNAMLGWYPEDPNTTPSDANNLPH